MLDNMRRLLIGCCLVVLLIGCNQHNDFYNKILTIFPNCEVQAIPGRNQDYAVRDTNGAVWYVTTDGWGTGAVTNLLFKAEK